MLGVVVFVVLSTVHVCFGASLNVKPACPKEDWLANHGCKCTSMLNTGSPAVVLQCQVFSLADIERLTQAMEKMEGNDRVLMMDGGGGVVPNLPAGFCRRLRVFELALVDLTVGTMQPEGFSKRPFEDCKLIDLIISNFYVGDDDWTFLSDMTSLLDVLIGNYDKLDFNPIVRNLPLSVKSLTLSRINNADTFINSGGLETLKGLRSLTLKHLPLKSFSPEVLPDRLNSLIFRNNSLSTIKTETIQNIKRLRMLEIGPNMLTSIDRNMLINFQGKLVVTGNPIECGIGTEWLEQRFREGTIEGMVECKSGLKMSSKKR